MYGYDSVFTASAHLLRNFSSRGSSIGWTSIILGKDVSLISLCQFLKIYLTCHCGFSGLRSSKSDNLAAIFRHRVERGEFSGC